MDLDVEMVAEKLREPASQPGRLVQLILEDELAELSGSTAAQADNAFMVSCQKLLIDARHIIIALEERHRGHFDKVAKADLVPGQESQVETCLLAPRGLAVAQLGRSHVSLVANNRIDSRLFALLVKLHRAVKVAVVGEGQGIHAVFLGMLDQLGNAVGAVEQAVMAMAMQMNEATIRHGWCSGTGVRRRS